MTFLIILLAIIAILLVVFIAWFAVTKINGNCPLCAMNKFVHPSKITIDTSDVPNYGGAAQTPPMGWSSWNLFRQNINEDLILEIADAMTASGLAEAGYEYINLDDCWHSSMRDDMGRLQGDLGTFKMGMPELIKTINKKGLKVGLYSSNGTMTCEDLPASLGNERIDAKTLASWGCEFFKYDFCHHSILKGDVPIIEKVEIDSHSLDKTITLLPAEATYTGRAKEVKCADLPSKKGIGLIGYGAGTASFDVTIIEQGKYALSLVYNKSMCRHERYLRVKINETDEYEILFPITMGASPTARIQILVELKSGANKITLYNPVVTTADSSYIQYSRMGKELQEATKEWAEFTGEEEKPIVYSICEWGMAFPYNWGAKAGNMWRTTPDIFAKWVSIKTIYNHTIKLYKYAGPGAWNDPDMLEIGNGNLSEDENKAHFTLWCMMAAPLVLGNDIRKFVDGNNQPVKENTALKIVTNKNLINIDQDPLGKPAKRIKHSPLTDIIARPLQNGDVAFCIFNKSSSKRTVTFDIDKLADDKYLNFNSQGGAYQVHDLWSDEWFNDTKINATLPKHSVKIYRIHI